MWTTLWTTGDKVGNKLGCLGAVPNGSGRVLNRSSTAPQSATPYGLRRHPGIHNFHSAYCYYCFLFSKDFKNNNRCGWTAAAAAPAG